MTTRLKTTGPTYSVSPKVVTYTDSLGANTVTSHPGYAHAYDYNSMVGEETPHYHKLLREGKLLPLTNFSHVIISASSSALVANAHYVSGTYWNNYHFSNYAGITEIGIISAADAEVVLSTLPFQELVQAAAARVYSKGFDALTFVAEEGKTIKMFVSLVTRIIQLYKQGLKYAAIQVIKHPKQSFLYFMNLWLEGRYGWRTLLYDIEDFHAAYTRSTEDRNRTRLSERVGTNRTQNIANQTNVVSMTSTGYLMTAFHAYGVDVTARGRFVADFARASYQFNPFVTGWELVPFSFVVDWLLSISSALNATSVLVLCETYSASYGYKLSLTKDTTFTYVPQISGATSTCSGSYHQELELRTRTPSEVPLRPFVKVNLDQWKVLDSLALTLQQMRRLRLI